MGRVKTRNGRRVRGSNEALQASAIRHTKAEQIMQGAIVNGLTVIAEQPARNTQGVLEWACVCLQEHSVLVPHFELSSGIAKCPKCVELDTRPHRESDADFKAWVKTHRQAYR